MNPKPVFPRGSVREVREFYDHIGWSRTEGDRYQNARYEDLRPVSRVYIGGSHRRVGRHLPPRGRLLLDAGSGPIQYPEYQEYSRGYQYRVCLDLSRTALLEARERIGSHGLFLQADMARLPLRAGTFDAAVSLHALHHLPVASQAEAVHELARVLAEGGRAVVVNGWPRSVLMSLASPLMGLAERRVAGVGAARAHTRADEQAPSADVHTSASGTWVHRVDWRWWQARKREGMRVDIRVWRSVSVRFLRALIHPRKGGEKIMAAVAWLEDRFPRFFGRFGQYPLIILSRGAGKGAL
ncbi:MAG: class I SAM-dependent methyltransferase [Anaerolineales bacterium]